MKVFVPLMRKPAPSRSAFVRSANASEPEFGSVIACTPTSVPSHRPGR